MKVNRKKLELAMARACMNTADLQVAAGLPRPSLNNVISGKGILPKTLGKVAQALEVDPADLIEEADSE